MRRVSLLLRFVTVSVAVLPRALFAQDARAPELARLEWFIGSAGNHTYYDDGPIETLPSPLASLFSDRAQGFGVESSLTTKVTRRVGLTSDFSMYFRSGPKAPGVFHVRSNAFFLMAGPELRVPGHSRFTPFARALAGVAHTTARFTTELPDITYTDSHARTGAAFALGGGLDIRVSARCSLRGTFDYVRTALGDADPEESGRQTHNRLSLGLLVR
jgi:opacity protein-like surface antigen